MFIANYQNGYVEVFETEPAPREQSQQEEEKKADITADNADEP